MKRAIWIVLAVCVLRDQAVALRAREPAAGSAASPDQGSAATVCWSEDFRVIPAPGETKVPRNASVWVLGGNYGPYRLRQGTNERSMPIVTLASPRIVNVKVGPLAANQSYTVLYADAELTTFTTSDRDDTTPPAAPNLIAVTATVDRGQLSIAMEVNPPSDARLLEVTFRDPQTEIVKQTFITGLHGLRGQVTNGCDGFSMTPGERVCIVASAIDLAGNHSESVERCIDVGREAPSPIPPGVVHLATHPEATRLTAPILMWSLALLAGMIAMALDSSRAHRRYRIAPGDPTHPDAVLRVARSLRRTGIAVVVMGAIAIAILVMLRLDDVQRVWLCGTPVFMIAIGIGVGLRAHRVTRLLDRAQAIAMTAGERYVFIVLDGELKAWLRASPALLMRAASLEIPVARIRR